MLILNCFWAKQILIDFQVCHRRRRVEFIAASGLCHASLQPTLSVARSATLGAAHAGWRLQRQRRQDGCSPRHQADRRSGAAHSVAMAAARRAVQQQPATSPLAPAQQPAASPCRAGRSGAGYTSAQRNSPWGVAHLVAARPGLRTASHTALRVSDRAMPRAAAGWDCGRLALLGTWAAVGYRHGWARSAWAAWIG